MVNIFIMSLYMILEQHIISHNDTSYLIYYSYFHIVVYFILWYKYTTI